MNKETKPDMSVEYGNGIGKVEFNPRKFTMANLRKMIKMQMSSGDSPIIGFTYRDGKTRTMDKEDMKAAKELNKKGLNNFITRVANQMDKAVMVSITRKVQEEPYHLNLHNDPIENFIENLDSIDAIRGDN